MRIAFFQDTGPPAPHGVGGSTEPFLEELQATRERVLARPRRVFTPTTTGARERSA